MKDLTPQQHRDLDRRVCQVLRQLQLYDERGAVDGAFASDAAVLSGFVRGEIREALHRLLAAHPAPTETLVHHGTVTIGPEPDGSVRQVAIVGVDPGAGDYSVRVEQAPQGAPAKLCPASAGPFDNLHVCSLPYAHDGDCLFTRVRGVVK